jgi:hypothetical protein
VARDLREAWELLRDATRREFFEEFLSDTSGEKKKACKKK